MKSTATHSADVEIAEDILTQVNAEPCIHLRKLARQLNTAPSALAPILDELIKRARLYDIRISNHRLFYAEPPSQDAAWLHLHPKAEAILAARGGTIADISRELNLPRSTVQHYRQALIKRGLWEDEEETRRRDAYERSRSDPEAAAALGLNLSTYAMWRKSRGLAAKRGVGQQVSRFDVGKHAKTKTGNRTRKSRKPA